MGEFAFDVVTTSRVVVTAEEGGAAKAAVEAALELADAEVLVGSGSGLLLTRLRISEPPQLVSVNGEDPFAPLEAALQAFRASASHASSTSKASMGGRDGPA